MRFLNQLKQSRRASTHLGPLSMCMHRFRHMLTCVQAQYPGRKINQRRLCAAAGRAWAAMGSEERAQYDALSDASKAAWAAHMQLQGPRRARRRVAMQPVHYDVEVSRGHMPAFQ